MENKKYKFFTLIAIIFTIHLCECVDSEITKFMKHLEVIPDLIPEGPQHFLKISYDSGVHADKGVELTPTQVQNQPKIEWEADENAYYTLSLSDPDAPSRTSPNRKEFNHWLVVNIPGDKINEGNVIAEYIGSGPPKNSGLHRYVFLLYKQPEKFNNSFEEMKTSYKNAKNRKNFSIKKFAKDNKLGTPIAGNFYQAKYDDYVPKLYKKIGF